MSLVPKICDFPSCPVDYPLWRRYARKPSPPQDVCIRVGMKASSRVIGRIPAAEIEGVHSLDEESRVQMWKEYRNIRDLNRKYTVFALSLAS